ncbi:MAG: hypothetical protein AB8H86_32665 [Polyangiales bacterium]
MSDDALRFLALVRKELGARDARLQLGGEVDEHALVHSLEAFDVVVLFDEAPDESGRIELLARLATLIETFVQTLEEVAAPVFHKTNHTRTALDEALEVLMGQAHAQTAFVVDDHSPEIWGCTFDPRGPENLDQARALIEVGALLEGRDFPKMLAEAEGLKEVDAALRQRIEGFRSVAGDRTLREWTTRLRAFDAMVHVRQELEPNSGRTRNVRHEASGPCIARSFGGAYHLVLVFEAVDFSELHAEAAMIHALPWIAKLTGALPPVDPGGGRVLKMRHLRPV